MMIRTKRTAGDYYSLSASDQCLHSIIGMKQTSIFASALVAVSSENNVYNGVLYGYGVNSA